MNAMKMKIIFLSVLFVVIFLSCKKEELSNVDNAEVMLLSSILMDDQPYYQFTYNDSNLVEAESSKLDFTMNHYNAKNQLVSSDNYWNNAILNNDVKVIETALTSGSLITAANGSKGGTFKYEYSNNDLLTKVSYTRQSGASEYSIFSYDENNRINKQDIYWNNVITGYIDYQYDGKGNLNKEMLYDVSVAGATELCTTTQYIFDNKHNPYKSFKNPPVPGINTNHNNIVKEIYTSHQGDAKGTDKIEVKENSYEYNINGYPISKNGNIKYTYK
jgi:hypothetical protein